MSILGEHFFKTSNAIYSYGLGCRELAVYGYLRSRAGSKDNCWPSMQTIAAACGCSDTTARKAVDELERRGFIRRVATYATDRKGRRPAHGVAGSMGRGGAAERAIFRLSGRK